MSAKKTPSANREDLVAQLDEVAQYMEILGENDFKIRAYRKGAQAIGASSDSLSDAATGKVKIAGVGEGLKSAIQEFLEDGRVKSLDELAAKVPAGVLELMEVPGLGAKKAMRIHKELGVGSIAELEYACKENRLVQLEGFGQALQAKILKSIAERAANAGKMRLDEATERAEQIEKNFGKTVEQVGALGRSAEIVEQLEWHVIGTEATAKALAAKLKWSEKPKKTTAKPFKIPLERLAGTLSDGTPGVIWASEKIDEPTRLWLCASQDTQKQIESDPSRFEGWECAWIESEWIGSGRKPKTDAYRRLRDGGMKGIFHCHTNYSDGSATLEEMVRAAEERGYEYIGISDHSQSAFYAQGLKVDRIQEQREKISELQKKVSIRIFHGIESDILADGALDYDEKTLGSFDFIVGSIHSRFKMDESQMTDRIVQALKAPQITMWGHPTGRLLLGRTGYQLDWAKCLKTAVKHGVAIELNANPHRLDVDWRLGEEIEKHGAWVCVNPDAHSVEGLADTVYGERMAEKAMLSKSHILNRLNVDEMERHLWERKKKRH